MAALQVTRSIPLVGPLLQQELSSFADYAKPEEACRRIQHALLYLPQLDLKHLIKFFAF